MKALRGVILGAVVVLGPAIAWAQEPLAVLTEMRVTHGKVEIKMAADPDWQAPKPLQSLRPGDQVRVTGEGRAVLVFTGGRGTQLVTPSNSPFTVQAPAGEGTTDRARTVLGNVTTFLLGQQREKTYQSLSVRSVRAQPPVILAPRDTRLLPGALTFEWAGSDRLAVTTEKETFTPWQMRRRPKARPRQPGPAAAASPQILPAPARPASAAPPP